MGKPQVSERPAAGFVEEKTKFHSPEDVQEIQEQMKDIERKRLRDQARATKVSAFLKDSFFRTDKTWPFLFWPVGGHQLSVKYFFPRKNLAIDQFMVAEKEMDRLDAAAVQFKRKVLKEKGIKYFPMFPEDRLMGLADYL